MRDYEQPKMPANWSGEAKNFYIGLVDVLDQLHEPVQESWLSSSLKQRLKAAEKESKAGDYSYGEQETGFKFVTDKPIYYITQQISLASGVLSDSDPIEGLGYILRYEGFVVASNGSQIPVNTDCATGEFVAYKAAPGNVFKLKSSVSGTAFITVYYTKGDDIPPIEDPMIFFDNGFVDGFTWLRSDTTGRPFAVQGESTYVETNFSHVEDEGYMMIYNSQRSYLVNRYAYVACKVQVPVGASKLHVVAAGANKAPRISIGLVSEGAVNSVAYTGSSLPFTPMTLSQSDYSVGISESAGTEQYIVINFSGYCDYRRDMRIYKVYFD